MSRPIEPVHYIEGLYDAAKAEADDHYEDRTAVDESATACKAE